MSKRITYLSLTALAAGVVLTGCGSPTPALIVHASSTPACGGSVVVTTLNGRNGVAVFVRSPGPDVVQVDVNSQVKTDHRHLSQQLTKDHDGASFSFSQLQTADSIMVNTRRNGVCSARIPAPIW